MSKKPKEPNHIQVYRVSTSKPSLWGEGKPSLYMVGRQGVNHQCEILNMYHNHSNFLSFSDVINFIKLFNLCDPSWKFFPFQRGWSIFTIRPKNTSTSIISLNLIYDAKNGRALMFSLSYFIISWNIAVFFLLLTYKSFLSVLLSRWIMASYWGRVCTAFFSLCRFH